MFDFSLVFGGLFASFLATLVTICYKTFDDSVIKP